MTSKIDKNTPKMHKIKALGKSILQYYCTIGLFGSRCPITKKFELWMYFWLYIVYMKRKFDEKVPGNFYSLIKPKQYVTPRTCMY